MRRIRSRFTVYFEDPFWVGLYEREDGGSFEACRIVFGSEPRDQEIYALLNSRFSEMRFSPKLDAGECIDRNVNPKRMQKEIRRSLERKPVSTRSQLALSKQREERKQERCSLSKEEKGRKQKEQYEKHRKKRMEKHKGH